MITIEEDTNHGVTKVNGETNRIASVRTLSHIDNKVEPGLRSK